MVRVRQAVFHEHLAPRWGNGYGDLFVARYSPALPPWTWMRALRRAVGVLARRRPGAALWVVPVTHEPTTRLLREHARHFPVPVAVSETPPSPGDFSFPPPRHGVPLPAPAFEITLPPGRTRRTLEVTVRLARAYTAEIASGALLSITAAREHLYLLMRRGFVRRQRDGQGRPLWTPTRRGISTALRLWCVPRGTPFPFRRERRSRASSRHRRTARLWNAWLRKSGYVVVMGWSEVTIPGLGRFAPDGLAFGTWEGQDTLFWLEVESGHEAGRRIAERAAIRLTMAEEWARGRKVRLIFTVLGRPWAVRAAARRLQPRQAAVLLASWSDFGRLPGPVPGRISRLHTVEERR